MMVEEDQQAPRDRKENGERQVRPVFKVSQDCLEKGDLLEIEVCPDNLVTPVRRESKGQSDHVVVEAQMDRQDDLANQDNEVLLEIGEHLGHRDVMG